MSTYGVCSKTPNRWEFLNGCLINSAWICCKNKDFVWEEPVYWDEARRSWRSSFKLLVSLCFSTYTVPPLHFLAFFFGSTEIFASNKKTDTNCSKEAMVRVQLGQGRLQKWEWKPALALMYPNCCFLAVVSVRLFIGGEYFSWSSSSTSGLPSVFSKLPILMIQFSKSIIEFSARNSILRIYNLHGAQVSTN